MDKLIGAQNSGKAPAGQPTIPDLATEVDCNFSQTFIGQCLFSRCSVPMMMEFKETLLVYYRFELHILFLNFWHDKKLFTNCCTVKAQELCMSRRWPPPTYDLSHEEGNPSKTGQYANSVVCTTPIYSLRFAT